MTKDEIRNILKISEKDLRLLGLWPLPKDYPEGYVWCRPPNLGPEVPAEPPTEMEDAADRLGKGLRRQFDAIAERVEKEWMEMNPGEIRVCILCKEWSCDASRGYSEYTPGTAWHMECRKRHYEVYGGDVGDEEEFRRYILKAMKCPDYVRIETHNDGEI